MSPEQRSRAHSAAATGLTVAVLLATLGPAAVYCLGMTYVAGNDPGHMRIYPENAWTDDVLRYVDANLADDDVLFVYGHEAYYYSNRFAPWRFVQLYEAFLAALFGLSLTDEQLAIYRQHTGREHPSKTQVPEAWLIVGRRGGKSRIAASVAVYLACFRDYTSVLAPGERDTLPVIASDRHQARTVFRYITGMLEGVPMLAQLVERQTRQSIELTNRVTIELHTASFRAIRGYTIIGAVCDEIAFWRSEDSANPDTEILNGLRPGMATIPDALALCISTPYARRGALWDAYRRHYGQDGNPVLVWQAPTRAMNPTVDERVIDDA